MSIEFDWEISEDDDEKVQPETPQSNRGKWLLRIIPLCIITFAAAYLYRQFNDSERQLRVEIQETLDFAQQAFEAGDGDLFFNLFDESDRSFRFQQLRPEIQASYAAGLRVTKAEQHETQIWANLEWDCDQGDSCTAGEEALQRIAFFEKTESGLKQVSTDEAYWGENVVSAHEWGVLSTLSADSPWVEQIAAVAAKTLSNSQESLTILIGDDYTVSTQPDSLYYPSPRLVGLNSDGQPSAAYWMGLEQAIAARVQPVTIRFAIPASAQTGGASIFIQQAANNFAAQHGGKITVELVTSPDLLSQDPEIWLQSVDGALLGGSETLIKRGAIRDLTDFTATDREFDTGDFYTQPWRAAWWEDRMWFVPWSTSLSLIYINNELFRSSSVEIPTADTTWVDFETSLSQLTLPDEEDRAFIDPTRDMLFAMAYSNDNACSEQDCIESLSQTAAASAIDWYRRSVHEQSILKDIASIPADDRGLVVRGTLSAHKQVASWVGSPIDYEYQLGLQVSTVLPFMEVSAETPLRMPLHVHGHVMSNYTDQPYWTWQWLKFLSYQAPPPRLRQIPARPSIARQSGFWEWLPTPIADAYKQVLPNGRPILIGEETYFTWEQLSAATNTAQSSNSIVQPSQTNWFTHP